jgi:hypothetical protein
MKSNLPHCMVALMLLLAGRLYADENRGISGGDSSYAGLLWHNGLLWISYYSSHSGKTSIYLAKAKIAGLK